MSDTPAPPTGPVHAAHVVRRRRARAAGPLAGDPARAEPRPDRRRSTELLGDPQRAYPVVHLTGTNGKTSTARMIDDLLRARGLRTGRFTSPHVESMTERISLDGEPLTEEAFVQAYPDIAPYLDLVDADQPHPLSFFETVVGMALRGLRRRPGRRRRGRGRHGRLVGRHQRRRRHRGGRDADRGRPRPLPRRPRRRPSRSRRPGSSSRAPRSSWPRRSDDVMAVLAERAQEVGATLLREGIDFGVVHRAAAVGGQVVDLRGLRGSLRRGVPAALRRPPGAERRRSRWPRRRCSPATTRWPTSWCARRFGGVTSPGSPRGGPARTDRPARRRPQPARCGGAGRGGARLLHLRPADRGRRR